jgi:hypothetical protein
MSCDYCDRVTGSEVRDILCTYSTVQKIYITSGKFVKRCKRPFMPRNLRCCAVNCIRKRLSHRSTAGRGGRVGGANACAERAVFSTVITGNVPRCWRDRESDSIRVACALHQFMSTVVNGSGRELDLSIFTVLL